MQQQQEFQARQIQLQNRHQTAQMQDNQQQNIGQMVHLPMQQQQQQQIMQQNQIVSQQHPMQNQQMQHPPPQITLVHNEVQYCMVFTILE